MIFIQAKTGGRVSCKWRYLMLSSDVLIICFLSLYIACDTELFDKRIKPWALPVLLFSEQINNKCKERISVDLDFQTVSPTDAFNSIMILCTPYLLPLAFLWSRNVVKISPVSFQIYFTAIWWIYFRISKHLVISSSDKQLYTLTCANRRNMHIFGMSRWSFT